MAKINTHYQKLQASYLFPEIGKRVQAYAAAHPAARIIRLGIGDVVLPLPAPIVDALKGCRRRDGAQRDLSRLRPRAGL